MLVCFMFFLFFFSGLRACVRVFKSLTGVEYRVQPEHRVLGVIHLLLQSAEGSPAKPHLGADPVRPHLPAPAVLLRDSLLRGEWWQGLSPHYLSDYYLLTMNRCSALPPSASTCSL